MDKNNKPTLYYCDPKKNIECSKKNCMYNTMHDQYPCNLTTNEKYKFDFDNDKSLINISELKHDVIIYALLSDRVSELRHTSKQERDENKYIEMEYLLAMYKSKINNNF